MIKALLQVPRDSEIDYGQKHRKSPMIQRLIMIKSRKSPMTQRLIMVKYQYLQTYTAQIKQNKP